MTRFVLASLLVLAGSLRGTAATHPTVRELRIENRGPGRVDEGYVRAHIRSAAGEALDRATIGRDVRTLLDTGRFTDVAVKVIPEGDGVVLVYGVVGRWRLAEQPVFEGAEHFSDAKLRDWLNLRPGDLVDDTVAGARTRELLKEYREDHYRSATVNWRIDPVDREAGLAHLTLMVDEGEKTKIKNFRITGNDAVSTRDLLDAVRFPKWWNPLRLFRSLEYDTEDLLVYRAAVRDVYLDRGYLDVAVAEPRVVRDAEGRRVIHIAVAEGRQYEIGGLTAAGIVLFPRDEVMPDPEKARGKTAAMSRINAYAREIRDFYGERGYIQTRVAPRLIPDRAAARVDVHFEVEEGELAYIRHIRISGNGRTRDKVIRRELTVYPGEIYNEVSVDRSRRRLENLGYFSRVNTFPAGTAYEGQKDLHIEVEEKATGQFMVGAGFSSIDKAVGFLEISQGNFDLTGWPNFTGGGQKLKFRSEFGSTRSEFDISFVEPWFLDRKLALGLDLYLTGVEYSDYDIERTGVSIGVTKPLPWNNRLSVKYRIEESVITDVADTNEYVIVDTDESYFFNWEEDKIESSVTVALSHDTRNRPYIPTRGTKVRLSYTVSGGPFGFDSDLYDLSLKARRYFNPWWRHVLAFRARYEVIEAYGDTADVGLSDRLFLGGGRNLRGFDYRDVGPKAVPADDDDGGSYRALGGKSLAFASAAYTIPIVSNVRVATFCDIGNVWWDSYELDLNDLASSAGVGIRLDMPGFPIRIDRAWVIESDDELTDEDAWSFWIGHDF